MPLRIHGPSARVYLAFLAAAALPVAIAGLIGIHFSLQTLRQENLAHLEQEMASRAETVGKFLEQLSSEVLYLSASASLDQLLEHPSDSARRELEKEYSVFATAYPYIYQVRYLDAAGRERVRVDRRSDGLHVVPERELQDKSGRYYVREALRLAPGRIYVSPLDLNIEHGRVETPERPVIRVATPLADRAGRAAGLLIINLHAELFLRQVEQLARVHGGTAYLFDRAGYYLARGETAREGEGFRMSPVESLRGLIPAAGIQRILRGESGVFEAFGLVIAHAPVQPQALSGHQESAPRGWSLALAYPQSRFFAAAFNLYLLYAVLAAALLATALAGWLVSRRLLKRLMDESRLRDRQMFQQEKLNTLGELAMGIAHEMGNPLAGMKAVTQMLGREEQPSPAMQKYLPRLEAEIDRLAAFLRTFHGYAAPREAQVQPCRLEDVLDDVLLWTRKEAKAKGIVIQHRQCGRGIPPLLADPRQLKQVLLNLVLNAIHAIDGPGRITLSMCNAPRDAAPDPAGQRRVHFCVEDDGPGIPVEIRPRLFEPFFTTRPDGTGLGLAVVKKIADQHGAEIRVHTGDSGGVRFEFVWPAAVAGASENQPCPAKETP